MRERYDGVDDVFFVMVVTPDRFFDDARRQIKRLRLQKRMRIYRQISETEKRCFYARCLGLYFVSKNEGFGIPVLEAQACGVPALISNHASLPEIAGGGAFMVNPDDPEEIARRLRRMITDTDTRARVIEAGKRNVERFSWERAARQISDMYNYLF